MRKVQVHQKEMKLQVPELPPTKRLRLPSTKINYAKHARMAKINPPVPLVRPRCRYVPNNRPSLLRQKFRNLDNLCNEAQSILNDLFEEIPNEYSDIPSEEVEECFIEPVAHFVTDEMKRPVTDSELREHTECAICLNEFIKGDKVAQLPCGHIFHSDCVGCWLFEHPNCPICREPTKL